ncbi:ABC transporter ATP-binding protein [Butyricimonas hominis]|uniref:ABC transporter ATP-binding protein n=1 Tax=Butyricimonas hominis TaxID=2763032 RepID=A0ABR7D5L7_9BACT|nr:ABC transporter ATP-binding protein [Butyricimonas hominis]MBC5623227.1 ABC transporter ATP-binding protein [Butyricimonas hominis]
MDTPIIHIEKLSHRYSVQWAVRDISLEIMHHGIYGLLGSNGAGKSTIMNIMCGVLKQTEGDIFIKGINTKTDPVEAKCHIGFLPQQPPLHLDLTVEEYLDYSARLRYIPHKEISKAISEVVERCGISHFKKRLIRNLSGGYQQRVGIAQAIIHNPDFVVLDEPTNGLDPNQIVEIRGLIKEIAQERTVILSTHILPEVQATCEYIYMVEKGKMVFSGTVDEFDNYILPTTIRVSLLANPSVEELKTIPGLLSAEHLGETDYRLQFADARNMVDEIIETCGVNNWRLSQVYLEKNSLDVVFAELSKK